MLDRLFNIKWLFFVSTKSDQIEEAILFILFAARVREKYGRKGANGLGRKGQNLEY